MAVTVPNTAQAAQIRIVMSEETCNHCWHNTGMQVQSLPPQKEQRCCKCGGRRYKRVVIPVDEPEGHGQYHPKLTGEAFEVE